MTISLGYVSLVVTRLLFIYYLLRAGPVFILSTGSAIVPISRNIVLIRRQPSDASAPRMKLVLEEC